MATESGHPTIPTPAGEKAEASQERGERARFGNHGNLNIVQKQRFGTGSHRVTVIDHAYPNTKTAVSRIKICTTTSSRWVKSAQIH